MNARESMLLNYDGLAAGTSLAGELCPACEGGQTRERSLSVSSEGGGIKWYCHRASCGFSGSTVGGMRQSSLPTQNVQCRGLVGRTLIRESSALDTSVEQILRDKYSITDRHRRIAGLGWDEEDNSLVMPVYGVRGEVLGANLRRLDGRTPKTKLHAEQGAIAWYVNHTATGIIIVEDQLSAIRASDYLTSVALLGTHFNEERCLAIKESGYQPVYLALDNDAWDRAISYVREYRYLLRLIPLRLSKDLKNMTDDELKQFMTENGIWTQ